MEIIALANRKGGVGKSTTTTALSSGLIEKGYKVLVIDLDAQRNTTSTLRARVEKNTIFDVLANDINVKETIRHTEGADIIPASKSLSGIDKLLDTMTGREYKLKEALEPVMSSYDYCIIDTPPSLSIVTINALTATNRVIIPAQADIYSLEGIKDLYEIIAPVKKYCNHSLKVDGILLTRYDKRSILTKEMTEVIKQYAEEQGTSLYDTKIREAIAIKEAQVKREVILNYAPKAKVTLDYKAFIEEELERM